MTSLPKIASTIHTFTTLKGEKILYTQFNGGQEKMLLEAKESEDDTIIIQTVLEVLRSIVRKGNLDALPTFEVEKLLLESRIVSVGPEVEIIIKDPDSGEKVEVTIDLSKAELSKNSTESRIHLGKTEGEGEDVYLNLKYPTFADLSDFSEISDEAKIRLCLDTVQTGENYLDLKEVSDEELTEWLLTLEKSSLNKLLEFVSDIPKLELQIDYRLKDGSEKTITLKDFKDFFT